jgi:hypothetical protein
MLQGGGSAVSELPLSEDAINDLGTDNPNQEDFKGKRYARDPKIRDAVRRRAGGKCELCGEQGFICADGTPYLESHHIPLRRTRVEARLQR